MLPSIENPVTGIPKERRERMGIVADKNEMGVKKHVHTPVTSGFSTYPSHLNWVCHTGYYNLVRSIINIGHFLNSYNINHYESHTIFVCSTAHPFLNYLLKIT